MDYSETQTNQTALCTLREVKKSFAKGARGVLNGVSLSIYGGEILGIRGKNGAGKSTLIELLADITSPDAGERTYGEGVRGRIAYVPQELSLYESMTGLQNLAFWGIAVGLPAKTIRTRSRWLLETLDLSDRGKDRVDTYSGGMKRRLHLASALMKTPALLLLDEPTVGADAESIKTILALLENLKRQGCGIVLISHLSEDLSRVCDRVVTLEDGRIGA